MIVIHPSTLRSLYCEMTFDGQPLASGTAFIAHLGEKFFLITCRHNVTGLNNNSGEVLSKTGGVPNQIVVWHNAYKNPGKWVQLVESLYDGDRPLWFEHPVYGGEADFVALPLTQLTGTTLHAYDVGVREENISVRPGEVVSVIGFPFGMSASNEITGSDKYAIWSTGFVASEPGIDVNELPLFYVDCRSRTGQSGSPVIAARGPGNVAFDSGKTVIVTEPITQLFGVYSGRVNPESDLGYVWKTSALRETLASI